MTTDSEERVRADIYGLEFSVCLSLRYHAKRRAFFDWLHHTSQIITSLTAILAASTAFADNLGVAFWSALVAAVIATLDSVIGFAQRARVYDNLYKRFSDLAAEITREESPQEQHYRNWKVNRLKIEKDEPTVIDALNVICHNEEVHIRNQSQYKYKINKYQKFWAQFFTLPPNEFDDLEKPPQKSNAA